MTFPIHCRVQQEEKGYSDRRRKKKILSSIGYQRKRCPEKARRLCGAEEEKVPLGSQNVLPILPPALPYSNPNARTSLIFDKVDKSPSHLSDADSLVRLRLWLLSRHERWLGHERRPRSRFRFSQRNDQNVVRQVPGVTRSLDPADQDTPELWEGGRLERTFRRDQVFMFAGNVEYDVEFGCAHSSHSEVSWFSLQLHLLCVTSGAVPVSLDLGHLGIPVDTTKRKVHVLNPALICHPRPGWYVDFVNLLQGGKSAVTLPEKASGEKASLVVKHSKTPRAAEIVDESCFQSGNGDRAVSGSGKRQARVLAVETLVEPDLLAAVALFARELGWEVGVT